MFRPSLITLIGITLVGLLLTLVLLPGIAGLLEGNFGYLCSQIDQGWNQQNNVTLSQALSDIYAWSFWRVSLRSESPPSYLLYEIGETIKAHGISPVNGR